MSGLWGGRFQEKPNDYFLAFNRSLPFDYRLFFSDIKGSEAYARGLNRAGILSKEELEVMLQALAELKLSGEKNPSFIKEGVASSHEDIHSFVEYELIKKVGDLGKKLHTGRSRNDQVATDIRLYVRDEIDETLRGIKALKTTLVSKAKAHQDVVLPGYTHLQRAQPITFAHYLLSYFEMFDRDASRLQDIRKRVNVLPLGSGALSGNNHAVDRHQLAKDLGFAEVSRNSLDATSDRDFIVEYLQAASLSMMHLSRLAEDLITYSSYEFSFVKMSDQVATGSSLMPQKKNPDALELIRGKTGRVYGDLMALLTTLKGLPSCYNKDLQEDKEPLFDGVLQWQGCLNIMATVIETMTIRADKMRHATEHGYLNATELADYLVKKGVPFREAHHLVGQVVMSAEEQGKTLTELPLTEFQNLCPKVEADVYEALDIDAAIKAKSSFGGTAFEQVAKALEEAEQRLGL